MRRFLQRSPSLLSRIFLHSPAKLRRSNTNIRLVRSIEPVTSRFVFFSSDTNPSPCSKPDDVLSKEELKKRIQSFLEDGNEDALPGLFEAIMNRKLSGKHDESDDEVMEQVRKYPINDALKADLTDSDIESDGEGDSDIECDVVEDVDLPDIDIKIDGRKSDSGSESD
ncbi:unnamed protein product [Cochlearia groenlandica]